MINYVCLPRLIRIVPATNWKINWGPGIISDQSTSKAVIISFTKFIKLKYNKLNLLINSYIYIINCLRHGHYFSSIQTTSKIDDKIDRLKIYLWKIYFHVKWTKVCSILLQKSCMNSYPKHNRPDRQTWPICFQ